MNKKIESNCETCIQYVYDEYYECYTCEADLDEDDMSHFLTDNVRYCPFYQLDDEYKIVRKQM